MNVYEIEERVAAGRRRDDDAWHVCESDWLRWRAGGCIGLPKRHKHGSRRLGNARRLREREDELRQRVEPRPTRCVGFGDSEGDGETS